MGAQYPIMSGSGLTGPAWCNLGTFTASSGVRMLRLDMTTQSFPGTFQSARLLFSTNNGAFVMNTFDSTPVAFNAYADVQTTSIEWFYGTLATDIVVRQNSNTSYSFYVRITPDHGVGFFTVYHSTGDSFQFIGTNAGSTRPSNGIYPLVSQPLNPNQIGAASSYNPSITGTFTCQNLTSTGLTTLYDFSASGIVALPNNAVAIESINGLQPALNAKASLGSNVNFGSCDLTGSLTFGGNLTGGPNGQLSAFKIIGTNGFESLSGSLTTTASSQTIYTFSGASNNRGFVIVEALAPNNSTVMGFFDSRAGNTFLTILARQGNVTGTTNLSTANGGTLNVTLTCNTSGQLRLSTPSIGTCSWSIIFI